MQQYRAQENDSIDLVCWKHYGREGVTPLVYEANPGLADYGPRLPAGVVVTLPDIPAGLVRVDVVRLWD